MKLQMTALCGLVLAGCVSVHERYDTHVHAHEHDLPPGSNEMLRAAIEAADGLEVIISDVIIPPNAEVPRHYHPGEEFVYVIEGSAIHVEEGKEDRLVMAGEAFTIPPEAIHAPRGGPDGARAIVFRVHVEGRAERFLVPEGAGK